MTSFNYYVIIVAAGSSKRFGPNDDKLLCKIHDRPVLAHAIINVVRSTAKGFIIVSSVNNIQNYTELGIKYGVQKFIQTIVGGEERADSVRKGIEYFNNKVTPDEIILIHDGARPFCPPEIFDKCAKSAEKHSAAVVAIPVVDTLKRVTENNEIIETVDRNDLWRAQTPQGFKYGLIRKAMKKKYNFTDDASAIEQLGIKPHIVLGTEMNIKITVPQDLEIAKAIYNIIQDL